jgi:hypothetical protein
MTDCEIEHWASVHHTPQDRWDSVPVPRVLACLSTRPPINFLVLDEHLVIARAVSQFEAHPDWRVQSLINWALEEVGRAVACIPNFEATSAENPSA